MEQFPQRGKSVLSSVPYSPFAQRWPPAQDLPQGTSVCCLLLYCQSLTRPRKWFNLLL